MTKEELSPRDDSGEPCEYCGHRKRNHYDVISSESFIGKCAVIGCKCKKFKPQNHSPQGCSKTGFLTDTQVRILGEDKEPDDYTSKLCAKENISGSDNDESLSDKIQQGNPDWLTTRVVKEFIKKLKEEICTDRGLRYMLAKQISAEEIIDKLAGKELI